MRVRRPIVAFAVIITLHLLLTACNVERDPTITGATPGAAPGPLETPAPEIIETGEEDAVARLESLSLSLEHVASGLHDPTSITHPPDGSDRLIVLERRGRVRVIEGGELLDEPFLDLVDQIESGMVEQGLLGLAFHPDYAGNGRLFVYYIGNDINSHISEFQVSDDDPNLADPDSERVLLHIDQPHYSHNGGQIAFGPDGYLYIGLGDGEDPGDPHGYSQDPGELLGAILRIDVDDDDPYGIPRDNPFVDDPDARGEVWAIGLRNPWRFSWDPETGDLYIADVGQHDIEEINVQRAGSAGGENYGWPIMEGDRCYGAEECEKDGLTMPVVTYDIRGTGECAIIGGYVYRGNLYPEMDGIYYSGDWCSGIIRGLAERNGEWLFRDILRTEFMISAFGVDRDGTLYVASFNGNEIYRVVPE
jgi:glucose/arabinose dehydrogenase